MQNKVENIQLAAGYTAAAVTGSVPVWAQHLEAWLSFGAVILAVLVGATTLFLNITKIFERRRK